MKFMKSRRKAEAYGTATAQVLRSVLVLALDLTSNESAAYAVVISTRPVKTHGKDTPRWVYITPLFMRTKGDVNNQKVGRKKKKKEYGHCLPSRRVRLSEISEPYPAPYVHL
jgi:hypothetical protein